MARRVKMNGSLTLCVAGRVNAGNATTHKNRRWLRICRRVIEHSCANLPKASRYDRELRSQRAFPGWSLSPSCSRIVEKGEGSGAFCKPVLGGDIHCNSASHHLFLESKTVTEAGSRAGCSDTLDDVAERIRSRTYLESTGEVSSAGKIFGSSSVRLLGPETTEATFKSEPRNWFRIIYIAAHGLANPKYPDSAALVLG